MKTIQKLLIDLGIISGSSFEKELSAYELSKSIILAQVGENPLSNSELPNEETPPVIIPMVTLTSALKNWPAT